MAIIMGAQELREQLIKKIEQADEETLVTYMNAISNFDTVEEDWADDISPELKEALLILKNRKSTKTYTTEEVFREARAKYGL